MSRLSRPSFSSFPSLFITATASPCQKMPQGSPSHPLSSLGVPRGTPLSQGLAAAWARAPGESLLLALQDWEVLEVSSPVSLWGIPSKLLSSQVSCHSQQG